MKFTAEKNGLAKILAGIKGITEKRNTVPILANILLIAKDGVLRLQATDLDLEVTDTLPVEIDREGEITVPSALLADIVKKMPAGSAITIATSDDSATVTVSAGRSRFKLQALPASDYPSITAGKFTHTFSMTGSELARMLARTSFAISNEETRYYLNGVHLSADETKLTAVATDGHRLGLAELPLPVGAEGMPGIIVPKKTVHELAKLTDAETIAVEVSDSKIRFTIGGVVLTSKLIDGTFPDYRRVIPVNNEKEMTVEKSVLAAAVDRVTTISSDRGRVVSFALTEGLLNLTMNSPDTGIANEELAVIYAEEGRFEIGFNAKYVAEMLAVIEGEMVIMRLADPGSPALVRGSGDADALSIIMPMRV